MATKARYTIMAAVLLLILSSAMTAKAQDSPPSIGLVTFGDKPRIGGGVCTGALVAPDLVLTAGHCVRGAVERPSSIHFAPASAQTRPFGNRRGARVILPDVRANPGNPFAGDVALVTLESPFPPDRVAPLQVTAPASRQFTLIAYDRDSPLVRHRNDDCKVAALGQGMIGLTCYVVSGNSGAPLLQWDGTQWRIAAVMVASSKARPVLSWAAAIPPDIRKLIADAQ